jgi:hypothetical protein
MSYESETEDYEPPPKCPRQCYHHVEYKQRVYRRTALKGDDDDSDGYICFSYHLNSQKG